MITSGFLDERLKLKTDSFSIIPMATVSWFSAFCVNEFDEFFHLRGQTLNLSSHAQQPASPKLEASDFYDSAGVEQWLQVQIRP